MSEISHLPIFFISHLIILVSYSIHFSLPNLRLLALCSALDELFNLDAKNSGTGQHIRKTQPTCKQSLLLTLLPTQKRTKPTD